MSIGTGQRLVEMDRKGVNYKFSSSGGLLTVLLLLVVCLLLVELPAPILDVLLVTNLVIALTLLLRGLFLDKPSSLFSFPTILVLATLCRLALNVSSTKLILLHGDSGLDAAGEVIRSFGSSVAGGDPIVGAIVFSIIAVVNFVVIAKGSARVAEVSARFALDSLPGKQLAIDSEVRAGNISSEEGLKRRAELGRESQFFGSMDGAMKWVQGDAMAGLAITFINVIGGVSLGVSRGLTFPDSLQTFGILTIGDGLVSIIPSLLISVSAGIIVSRVESENSGGAGDDVFIQIFSDPRAAIVAGSASLIFAVFGLFGILSVPFLPFFIVGSGILGALYFNRNSFIKEGENQSASSKEVDKALLLEDTSKSLTLELDRAILGNYLGLSDDESKSERYSQFIGVFNSMRSDLFSTRGIPIAGLKCVVNPGLTRGEYRVLVRNEEVRSGLVNLDRTMVATNNNVLGPFGVKVLESTYHPIDKTKASWVLSRQGGYPSLRHLGIQSYNSAEFLALEVVAAALDVVDEVFGVDETRKLLSHTPNVSEISSEVFKEGGMSYSEFTELLRRLIREGVGIQDVRLILEGSLEFIDLYPQPEDRQEWLADLHMHVRKVLSRSIVNTSLGPGDSLRAFLLSSDIEDEFRSATSIWDRNRTRPPLDLDFEVSLKKQVEQMFNPVLERGYVPIVVLCPDDIRSAVQEFFIRNIANSSLVKAVAFQELSERVKPEAIGVVSVSN